MTHSIVCLSVCPSLCLPQPFRVKPGSSWRCQRRSVPSVQQEVIPSAAASASTNGIPCLLDSVAWRPRWKTAPTEMTSSPATGLREAWERKWKLGKYVTHFVFNDVSSSSSWVPQGNYLESNRDECTVSLIYAVHLKKQGSVSFEYQYPDNNLLFEFFVSRKHSFTCICQLMWVMRAHSLPVSVSLCESSVPSS